MLGIKLSDQAIRKKKRLIFLSLILSSVVGLNKKLLNMAIAFYKLFKTNLQISKTLMAEINFGLLKYLEKSELKNHVPFF